MVLRNELSSVEKELAEDYKSYHQVPEAKILF